MGTGQWACRLTPRYSLELKLSFKLTTRRTTLSMSNPHQPPHSDNGMHWTSKVMRSGRRQRTLSTIVNTVTLSGSQRGSTLGRTVTTAAHSDAVCDGTSSQHDAGQLAGNTKVSECITQSRDDRDDSQASTSEPPPLPEIQLALAEDLTGQVFGSINDYVASGAFGTFTDVNGDGRRALSRSGQWAVPM
ncbi:hypothetical protein DFJ58DRAFT_31009 [Suillus subalutaceus]|uniref:uncharacterized protein n=1 Tax=Suillus subalutaceus TaxID=48586 RepID=UPI001B8762EE|nr:uncharacterized protein DFJ58DRAFT_31009 [Suillus subalutaceus]KAG1844190.1 hypothetical protein DFJ58DRAFT_31009 [Suillus subalutaceus]